MAKKKLDTIAEAHFIAVGKDCKERTCKLVVHKPYPEDPQVWCCLVRYQGFGGNVSRPTHGDDSLQALCLALKLVANIMEIERDGGLKFFYPSELGGELEPVDFDDYLPSFWLRNKETESTD